ncbi:hypothetical protein [Haloferax sp. DFSO52]|uniref:hypothetical protein n=1 Tax=Haloferax sp. DFSO52 TaxID=3388505 RepID=UPI003A88E40A
MRPSTLTLVLAIVLLSTGCLGVTPSTEPTRTETTQTTTATPTPTSTPTPTPNPPISDDEAKERALDHHETQTLDSIDHYDRYGVGHGSARVTNRTGSGVYVHFEQEYWYTSGDVEADRVTEATYFVNETTVRQVYR